MNLQVSAVAEDTVLVSFAQSNERELAVSNNSQHTLSMKDKNAYMSCLFNKILNTKPPWLIDLCPAYETLLLTYDIFAADQWLVKAHIRHLIKTINQSVAANNALGTNDMSGNMHTVPVLYGRGLSTKLRDMPTDIEAICAAKNIGASEVIQLHQDNVYDVYAVGFLPNFAYLGELPEQLNTPRLASPRSKVPTGAVAIADKQTAIYPQLSQGGWHILGYTPLSLDLSYDIGTKSKKVIEEGGQALSFKVGDKVSFYAIDEDEFFQIQASQHA